MRNGAGNFCTAAAVAGEATAAAFELHVNIASPAVLCGHTVMVAPPTRLVSAPHTAVHATTPAVAAAAAVAAPLKQLPPCVGCKPARFPVALNGHTRLVALLARSASATCAPARVMAPAATTAAAAGGTAAGAAGATVATPGLQADATPLRSQPTAPPLSSRTRLVTTRAAV